MDARRNLKHGLVSSILTFLILMPLSACSQMKTVQWSEEVRLSDGRIIVVTRDQHYHFVGAPGFGTQWRFDRGRIQAPPKSMDDHQLSWEGNGQPLALDKAIDGSIYIVVVPNWQLSQELSLAEGVNHVAFKYAGSNSWLLTPIDKLPSEMKPNLLASTYTLFIEQKLPNGQLIDVLTKMKVDADPAIGQIFRGWKEIK